MSAQQREYLGDGCYAEVEGDRVVLLTGNGLIITNRIVLEPEVLRALAAYVARLACGKLDAVDEAKFDPASY